MLQETMKKITDAESEADEIIRKAKEEADYTVAAAKKEAADMIAAAGSASRESMKSAEGAGRSEEEELTVKAMDIATAEIAHLRERASSMEGEVTSMIIAELVG